MLTTTILRCLRLPFGPGSRHLNSQTSRPPCRSVRIMLPFCINLPLSASNAKNCPQDWQAQFRHRLSTGMAKSATNREKLLLSCGDLQKHLAKLRLVVGAYFAWPDAPERSRSLSSPLPCAASPELGPGCPIHSRSLRMCARAHHPQSSAWPKGGLALMGICRVARPKSRR